MLSAITRKSIGLAPAPRCHSVTLIKSGVDKADPLALALLWVDGSADLGGSNALESTVSAQ